MDGRGHRELSLEIPAGRTVRVSAAAEGVDVRVTLLDVDGGLATTADAPQRRLGLETLLMEPQAVARSWRVRIDGADHGGARGTVTVRVEALVTHSPADQRRVEATGLEARACHEATSPEQAAAAFEAAATLHERNDDIRAAAQARLHAAGVRYEHLSQWDRTAALAARAARGFAAAGDEVRAAYALRVEGAALSAAAARSDNPAVRDRRIQQARARLSEAGRRLEVIGEGYQAGYAYNYRGVSFHDAGERERAAADYRRALALFTAAGDAPGQALSRQSLAQLAHEDGRLLEALREFDAALRLIPRAEQPENYAHALNNSALPLTVLGRFDEAIGRYYTAAELLRAAGDRAGEARALHGIGTTLRHAGEPERARDLLQSAIQLRADLGARRDQSISLTVLGQIELDLGRTDAAIGLHRQALQLVTAPGDRARALLALARALAAAGRIEEARITLDSVTALDLPPTHRHVGNAWAELGSLAARSGHPDAAHAAFARAIAAHRANGSDLELARALSQRAAALALEGAMQAVLGDTAEALDLFDRVGLAGTHGEARAVFLSTQRNVAELQIATLLARARATEARDAAAARRDRLAALATSDRVRARLLDQGRDDVSSISDGRREELYAELAGKRARRDRLLDAAEPDAAELSRLATDIGLLRAQLANRTDTPAMQVGGLAATSGGALDLPAGAVFIEYFLGRSHSWRFVRAGDLFAVDELPPAAEIERAARALHDMWRTAPGIRAAGRPVDAASLARTLFGALPSTSNSDELVVVPDGALHIVPLAVLARLALPDAESTPVVLAPSLRSVAIPSPKSTRPAHLLAVVADPVFQSDDPRLPATVRTATALVTTPTANSGMPLTRGGVARQHLQRLPATAAEARGIVALAGTPPPDTVLFTGLAANRATLAAAGLGDFRLLHFATHAWADNEDPALATLALSSWDAAGRPLDGVLRLHEITTLQLHADLVVLSACETALGREVAGEGPVSLAQGFMRAGAGAVLATLWPVPDSSTAALMGAFYRELLGHGTSPAIALARAQRQLRSHPKWSDPYYWAGFQLTDRDGRSAHDVVQR
ncbi:MAG: CHAT domain-containing protein [Steroidobacteraceae bacterium]|nr:CHAT domain-containing protein [Steroidobacteraceae bacterium]